MAYDGEYAKYQTINRITETERVKQLLNRAKIFIPESEKTAIAPAAAPDTAKEQPKLVLAIDGSNTEVDIKSDYPGAKVGYCTVACVLIDLILVEKLEKLRPFDPVKYRETEQAAAIDAAFPCSNIVTRRQISAKSSFREELFDYFGSIIIDEDDKIRLLDTYEALLELKPTSNPAGCPYSDCEEKLDIRKGHTECKKCRRPVYSTDELRIHERFKDLGANGEILSYVMQVWERLFLIHLLRCFEKKGLLSQLDKIAFFIDGPLAIFGPPAWLSASIKKELKRLNGLVRKETGKDLIIIGIEKGGDFVSHFEEIDKPDSNGAVLFSHRSFVLLTDSYIKERIVFSESKKRYGADTYFGRKFFYKTAEGGRIVGSIPFLSDDQDTLEFDDISLYPQFGTICSMLDALISSRYPNALSPVVSAHAQAAIPLNIGTKVLQQLAKAIMGVN